MTKCEYCDTELECLGGCSAHPANWYCPNKDCPRKPKAQEAKPRREGMNNTQLLEAIREAINISKHNGEEAELLELLVTGAEGWEMRLQEIEAEKDDD